MLPVGVSVWRFREYPSPVQALGIALAAVALPILSATSAVRSEGETRRAFDWLILVLFLSTGVSQVLMKEFSATRPPEDLPVYSAALFAAATVFTVLWMAFADPKGPPERAPRAAGSWATSEWALGTALGGANVLQLVFLLLALEALPAVVVFPVSAVLGVVFNVLASMLFWRERPRPAAWLGIALAVLAVVLLQVRR
jgi:drug/metabolite transporter (DMT)-like permease